MSQRLARMSTRVAQLVLALLAGAYLVYFADHIRQLFGFAYPLDYGEGPLLAQVERLRAGVPIWRLYADPAQPPFLVVNYPPLYLLLGAGLAPLLGSTLVAGRLISLLAALGCVAALALLARAWRPWVAVAISLLLLTVPVVREWAALMRVDLLGICLGLWGLVVLVGGARLTPGRAVGAGALLLACLFTKPSLIAAPVAAGGWLLWRLWRDAGARLATLRAGLALGASVALGGAVLFGLLQWASDGWFVLHVVAANANRWEAPLAQGFWEQQLALRWPLGVAALLGAALLIWRRDGAALVLPALYTLGGIVVAAGVGKVGAYSNYFLELYVGLIWVVARGAQAGDYAQMTQRGPGQSGPAFAEARGVIRANSLHYLLLSALYLLLATALLRYPPLWDATRLRPAGLIEPSPPRLAFGRYGLWADAARERELLAAQTRVGEALVREARAAGPAIFTDMPGVAAAAGVGSPLQAFEARQLLDQGLIEEEALLVELANGTLPLAVIDYLGNWLSPAVIEILQRRYAHDGSLGTYDLYRPVETGPLQPLAAPFAVASGTLELAGYSLAAPAGAAYEPGELLALSLSWRRVGPAPAAPLSVVVRLATPEGYPLLENERPLLYGVFPPARWPAGATLQHMQPLALPAELPPGRFAVEVGLRDGEGDDRPFTAIATFQVEALGGEQAETGHFVPAGLRRAWAELGGLERAGLPLTPAVPFAWGRLQCFELLCLELRDGAVLQRPLGVTLYLAETIRGEGCGTGGVGPDGLCAGFAAAALRYAATGEPISGELLRNGWAVQWSEHARFERPPAGGDTFLGRLGDESLRLPPGAVYRWP